MDRKILINPYIHQDAKLKKEKFLERIKNVRNIRTSILERNFLPGEEIEWEILEELHKAINTGIFNFGIKGSKIFAFEIDNDLYDWFKKNDLITIQKQVINWIAAVYLSRPDKNEYLDNYIYPPILNEAKKVIQKHYSSNFAEKYKLLDEEVDLWEKSIDVKIDASKHDAFETFDEEHSDKIEKLSAEKDREYINAALSYINCLPPKKLKNPIAKERIVIFDESGLKYSPLIRVRIGYFTDRDWILIVERNLQEAKKIFKSEIERGTLSNVDIEIMLQKAEIDNLNRSGESDKSMWDKWFYSYRNFEKTNNHIYQLFEDESLIGLIYIIRQRNTNYFKIGWTEQKKGLSEKQSVENRVVSLQTGNPEPLDIVGYFKASGTKTEKTIHSVFNSKRRTGEWFLLSDSDWQNLLNDNCRINNNIF